MPLTQQWQKLKNKKQKRIISRLGENIEQMKSSVTNCWTVNWHTALEKTFAVFIKSELSL